MAYIFLVIGMAVAAVGVVWHATREARRHGTGTAEELLASSTNDGKLVPKYPKYWNRKV